MAYKPMDVPDFIFTFLDPHKVVRKATKENGWNLEFNRIAWGGENPKYDIRSWSQDHKRFGKGVSLSEDDCKALRNILVDKFGPADDTPIEQIELSLDVSGCE